MVNKKGRDKQCKNVLWALAIVGAIAAVAGIAYAVYCFFTPDYLEDFEDDFEDDSMMISSMTKIRYKSYKKCEKKSRIFCLHFFLAIVREKVFSL